MNIGVLIICTGKYDVFFKDLHQSSESFFLKEHKKHYFIFTDSSNIEPSDNFTIINQEFLGWPYDTMLRFKMFNKIKEDLLKMDFLFFLNANMKFMSTVGEEVLPNKLQDFLCGVNHPGYFNKDSSQFPYERRPASSFYISDGKTYFQGCFIGGKSDYFMDMFKVLEDKMDLDLNNDIIPIYHDESALNWYYKDRNPLILNPSYAFPESSALDFEKKIIQRNKINYGGYDFLRQIKK